MGLDKPRGKEKKVKGKEKPRGSGAADVIKKGTRAAVSRAAGKDAGSGRGAGTPGGLFEELEGLEDAE